VPESINFNTVEQLLIGWHHRVVSGTFFLQKHLFEYSSFSLEVSSPLNESYVHWCQTVPID
jgi:hypothetical protein